MLDNSLVNSWLTRVSHVSLLRVGKLRLWPGALNIAAVKDYGFQASPFLS